MMNQRKIWLLVACICLSLFAQAQREFSRLTDNFSDGRPEKDAVQQFMRASHPAAKSRDKVNMLLPEEGLYFYRNDPPGWPERWDYDDNDRLIFCISADMEIFYNRAFLKEGWNILDTVTWYRDTAHTIPTRRTFFNYHYYDITPVDSFYMEMIVQNWNITEQRWENYQKSYDSYADTVMFNLP